jgi:hypothetical protein
MYNLELSEKELNNVIEALQFTCRNLTAPVRWEENVVLLKRIKSMDEKFHYAVNEYFSV